MTSSSQNNWVEYALNWDIPQNGILQVMSANSSDATVYFDDMSVELAETMIVQETHYYPFGGVLKGIGKEGNNKYLYNGGTEREDSFDIGLDETDFRRYDANLGRFTGIDALAEKYNPLTPYQYAANNPLKYNDPTGLKISAGNLSNPGFFSDEAWQMIVGVATMAEQSGKERYKVYFNAENITDADGRDITDQFLSILKANGGGKNIRIWENPIINHFGKKIGTIRSSEPGAFLLNDAYLDNVSNSLLQTIYDNDFLNKMFRKIHFDSEKSAKAMSDMWDYAVKNNLELAGFFYLNTETATVYFRLDPGSAISSTKSRYFPTPGIGEVTLANLHTHQMELFSPGSIYYLKRPDGEDRIFNHQYSELGRNGSDGNKVIGDPRAIYTIGSQYIDMFHPKGKSYSQNNVILRSDAFTANGAYNLMWHVLDKFSKL